MKQVTLGTREMFQMTEIKPDGQNFIYGNIQSKYFTCLGIKITFKNLNN